MQQHVTQGSDTVVAPGSRRYTVRNYWLLIGAIVAFFIASSLLPEPLRDEILWNKTLPFFQLLNSTPWLAFIFSVVWGAIFIAPFMNFPATMFSTQSTWKKLEKRRQLAVENRLRGVETVTAPLPEVFPSLPASLSVRICRNQRATLIGGTIYAVLIGLVLLAFASEWQINLQYLVQKGEVSGWLLLGAGFELLIFCLIISPVITAFLFAPRQRLIATQDGLICYHRLRFSFIPWHEALLFAVIAEQNQTLIYELASSTSLIRWSSKPGYSYGNIFPPATVGVAPLGLLCAENSPEEYQWQVRQLIAMVATGTDLPLYDLREPVKNVQAKQRWF